MSPDRASLRTLALPALATLAAAFAATAACATNEQYQVYARSCSPYIVGGCEEQTVTTATAGLNIGGAFASAGGFGGGFAMASSGFEPGAPTLLEDGLYREGSIGYMTYSFQVKGAPDTLVPLHMIGSVSVSPIRLTNGSGVATLVDGAPGPAPSDQFRIVGSATLQVSASVLTPYPDSGASASFESIYDPRGYTYCSNCGGGGASFDKTVWVYSNSDINVTLNTSTLLEYTSYGGGNGTTVFGSVEAETDPVFSIDDPAYSAFTVVGVPTGLPPTGTGGGSVPEPASWAMMLAGFGVVGGAMRTRGRRAATAV